MQTRTRSASSSASGTNGAQPHKRTASQQSETKEQSTDNVSTNGKEPVTILKAKRRSGDESKKPIVVDESVLSWVDLVMGAVEMDLFNLDSKSKKRRRSRLEESESEEKEDSNNQESNSRSKHQKHKVDPKLSYHVELFELRSKYRLPNSLEMKPGYEDALLVLNKKHHRKPEDDALFYDLGEDGTRRKVGFDKNLNSSVEDFAARRNVRQKVFDDVTKLMKSGNISAALGALKSIAPAPKPVPVEETVEYLPPPPPVHHPVAPKPAAAPASSSDPVAPVSTSHSRTRSKSSSASAPPRPAPRPMVITQPRSRKPQ